MNDRDIININLWDSTTKSFPLNQPLVILGSNGSGKTRLGAKIEELNDKNYKQINYGQHSVRRITAQKSLTIPENLSFAGLSSSTYKHLTENYQGAHDNKLNSQYGNNPFTRESDDYSRVLSYLFSKSNSELDNRHRKGRTDGFSPLTQKVENIWNKILPNRDLSLRDSEVKAKPKGKSDEKGLYHGKNMSDGERVILYLIAQVVTALDNSILIIDEPEVHIHRAIVQSVWNSLEVARPDCFFIYITHDINFALSRNTSEHLWVKSFDGEKWDTQFVPRDINSSFPDDLLYEILGSRQRILFVEGTHNSLDYQLYKAYYENKDFLVLPCNGCKNVIQHVKSKESYANLGFLEVYGIIDKDYRTQSEIDNLRSHGIQTLSLAEVENLFIISEVMDIIGKITLSKDTSITEAKDTILSSYLRDSSRQIEQSFQSRLRYKLTCFSTKTNKLDAKQIAEKINEEFSEDKLEELKREITDEFNSINNNDINEVLSVYNKKGLVSDVQKKLGIQGYRERVLQLLRSADSGNELNKGKLIQALDKYLPSFQEDVAK